ncbi:MAG: LysR family transcriptional regulator [Burkholderiales bacterium]
MHIRDLDLNLLRVFDAVHRHRSVSRAAEQLGLSQPAVSHALTRLRLLLKDALFVRSGAGMRPTPRADQLALAIAAALEMLEQALLEAEVFDPRRSSKTFRLHMSDMGEGVFLPGLMHDVRRVAPGVRIDSYQFEIAQIEEALEVGGLDFAIGFLPGVEGTAQHALLDDRYVLLMRAGHPQAEAAAGAKGLRGLDYILVRQHTQTAHLLQRLGLQDRVRLSIPHFMVLPRLVADTDLAVILPRQTALGFAEGGAFRIVETDFGEAGFTVALHWSRRRGNDPALRWLRELIVERFAKLEATPHATKAAPAR